MKFQIDEFVSVELEQFDDSSFSIVLTDPENFTCFNLNEAKTLRNALDLMISEVEKTEKEWLNER